MNTTTEETTALILSGQGYDLQIAPEAEARKAELLGIARAVQHVRDNDESAEAQYHSRSLAAMRIEVEKCRKIVKEPVNRIGKLIDQAAKDFVAEIDAEECRIKKLIGDHAAEVARLRRIKEEEERRAFEEARAAREAAEAAAAAAETSGKIADIIAAKQAESARMDALAARMGASDEVAAAKVADGVRFAWDFEVLNIHALAMAEPRFVRIEPKRAEILTDIKERADAGLPMTDREWAVIGLRVFKKPVVSSR
jgi:Xaa-Pro aminopeptidase